MSSQQSPANLQSSVDRDKIYQWIIELSNPETRENALLELRYSEVLHIQLLMHAFEYLDCSYFMLQDIYVLSNTHTCSSVLITIIVGNDYRPGSLSSYFF
jgi:hypothetical protein